MKKTIILANGRHLNREIMIKPTKHNLKKLEDLFTTLEYDIRYEKGNFQSGYCIVQDKKVAVINKFFDTEGRIGCLLDILQSTEISEEQFEDPKMKKFFRELINLEK